MIAGEWVRSKAGCARNRNPSPPVRLRTLSLGIIPRLSCRNTPAVTLQPRQSLPPPLSGTTALVSQNALIALRLVFIALGAGHRLNVR